MTFYSSRFYLKPELKNHWIHYSCERDEHNQLSPVPRSHSSSKINTYKNRLTYNHCLYESLVNQADDSKRALDLKRSFNSRIGEYTDLTNSVPSDYKLNSREKYNSEISRSKNCNSSLSNYNDQNKIELNEINQPKTQKTRMKNLILYPIISNDKNMQVKNLKMSRFKKELYDELDKLVNITTHQCNFENKDDISMKKLFKSKTESSYKNKFSNGMIKDVKQNNHQLNNSNVKLKTIGDYIQAKSLNTKEN